MLLSPAGRGELIDLALLVWLALTVLSVAYTAWDIRSTPEMTVMKPGWLLIILFTGPIGAAVYVLSCKEPAPGMHENFVRPLWKQGVGSTIHCAAGDATGIIAAAAISSVLGFPMGIDFAVEYVVGFAFGLFVFQALFSRGIMGGTYWNSVKRTVLPEFLSMNMMMAGMGPVMIILMTRYPSAMHPSSLRFWGVMSLATLVGMAVGYPLNVWLVQAGLKHGMGTKRVLGDGGHSTGAEMASLRSKTAEIHSPYMRS